MRDQQATTGSNSADSDSVLLIGAEIADGTGTPLRAGDVLVEDGYIQAVRPPGQLPHDRPTRDLTGMVLAPGFIDVHSHADNAPLLTDDDTTKILQGVTTEVVGNCGFSLAPRTSEHADTLAAFLQRLFPPIDFRWSGFHELFATLDDAGYVTNYCPLIGHGTVRIAAQGMAEQAPDREARRVMREAVDEGMTAGAFGLSSGLSYPPAVFSTTDELRDLATVLGGDGVYATHMRDEGAGLLDAVDEALQIGATAGRTHVSHLKAAGPDNWGTLPQALDRLRGARQAGHQVLHDVYPYTASSTMLAAVLPPEFLAGDAETVLARLSRQDRRAELAEALADEDFTRILVATTGSHEHEGRTIAEIAADEGRTGVQALIEVLLAEKLQASMVSFSMHEDDLEQALANEHTMIGSDGLPPGTGGKPHPRLFGTFPRVLGRYCRDREIFGIAEAVRRMTSLPARQFRVPERGLLAPNYRADLVAFEPHTVRDVGDYTDPVHPPQGVSWVCQSGRTVVDSGDYVGPRAGRRLRPAY